MKNNKCKYLLLILISFSLLQSCKKFLAAKPDKSLALPETLNDLQLMLDNYSLLNGGYPAIGEVSSDNFYLTDASWGSTSQSDQHYYLWQPYDNNVGDYENPNTAITTVNLILESLKKINDISQTKTVQADKIEGSALFFRAFSYWELAQYFCKGYNKVTASSDLGLPIRLSSSVIEKYKRSSVEQTYQQIISDLNRAIPLLPDTADVKYHVSKAAAYGLFSRTYLSMQDYNKAGMYADSCLMLYDTLMDYNSDPSINSNSSTMAFAKWNKEVIFDAFSRSESVLSRTREIVDTSLYTSYQDNDLRKKLFFQLNSSKNGYYFKGNYTGLSSAAMFYGITTDEMLLTRAECEARANNQVKALKDLNALLYTRWVSGTFQPINISNQDSLLSTILDERRKELIFRGLRWTDLRRLNEEPKYQLSLTREINGTKYTLLPNAARYVFLFPKQSIDLSGMQQNL